jgi:phosphoenolpyruvate-protein kinase (PTS system EI component)
LVEQADPGYDWIFSHKIRGLVTKYGGSNSHMAIRCAELGIPAAIGVGDGLYDILLRQKTILLDCCEKRINYE